MRRRGLRAAATALAVVAATASLLLPGAASADDRTPSPGQRYVALGDSYTSSPFTGPPAGGPPGCLRSANNYPHVVAEGIAAQLTDVSCSGAQTKDFAAPQQVNGGANPPQYEALGGDTQLVTVGIGGNDIGFGDIVTGCISPVNVGTPCKDRFTRADGTDEIEARIDVLEDSLAGVVQQVQRRAPQAKLVMVGYPAILPSEGPGCHPLVPYTSGDVDYLRGVISKLNRAVADAAEAGGATYADTLTPTVGHDVCTLPPVRWFEGLAPTAPAAPAHPNAQGSAGMGRAVLATLGRGAD